MQEKTDVVVDLKRTAKLFFIVFAIVIMIICLSVYYSGRRAAENAAREVIASEQAEQARQQKITDEWNALSPAEQVATKLIGAKPVNSAWDGAVPEVLVYLNENLKDPDSIKFVSWSPVTLFEFKKITAWGVRVKYRAKNSFGGYELADQVFLIQHGTVISVQDM